MLFLSCASTSSNRFKRSRHVSTSHTGRNVATGPCVSLIEGDHIVGLRFVCGLHLFLMNPTNKIVVLACRHPPHPNLGFIILFVLHYSKNCHRQESHPEVIITSFPLLLHNRNAPSYRSMVKHLL